MEIPVIASLNGTSMQGWENFAKLIQEAGADALELNLYFIPTDVHLNGYSVEQHYLDVVQSVKAAVSIPVAVKLSPYFSNMANMAKKLDVAGVDALVLFNRFLQPDIDIETLEMNPRLSYSSDAEMRQTLTWIGLIYGHVQASLAATSGIHSPEAVIKMLLVGADVAMLASTLYRNGVEYIRVVEEGLKTWLEAKEYASVNQLKGSMSQLHTDNPAAFERAHYLKALRSFQFLAK